MVISSRERYISFACVLAGALLAADRLAWSPYIDHRNELLEQKQVKIKAVADAQHILNQEKRLRRILAAMGPSVELDPSEVEVRFLHLFTDWEQQAGVNNASFRRIRSSEESGFTHLTFHVSASGPNVAVAMLVYAAESSGLPIRIDDFHVTPKREGEELQLEVNVSTLCRKNVADARPRPASTETASITPTGARP